MSKNGWINSELFLKFLQHFLKFVPAARPIMLIMDSHCSHVSPEVLKFGQENDIVFVTFPSHTTHLLQPLDVGVFGPMKQSWRSKVLAHLRVKGSKPTRKDFVPIFIDVHRDAVTPNNIVKAFARTGIYPFNRNALPDKTFHVSEVHETGDGVIPDAEEAVTGIMTPVRPFRGLRKRECCNEIATFLCRWLIRKRARLSNCSQQTSATCNVRETIEK